ncbi:MAG: MerR family transcriptional regulator [Candidatus Melainabacteria bacterium]|uniref:MerR family transcriptional regulator n=1 Tax=Candidatus Obscuribacter phosphatis TaxID=1906157 RepID=A0A8J7PF44_9BACT|nr:MerR family transcriptional regulator [Candidatus Obscuribacter phosphatis]MCA0313707.1 MerR family transcriptional regulator [Candidatus Melainabacteria bacterium]
MSRSKVEGTKIAQAAKDLNVTSVTIRRYIQEFNIETATDENGIKVLPKRALKELQEIRKLKEDGLTNPKVMEVLEEMRAKSDDDEKEKPESKKRVIKATAKATPKSKTKKAEVEDEDEEEELEEEKPRTISSRAKGKPARTVKSKAQKDEAEEDSETEVEDVEKTSLGEDSESEDEGEEKAKEEGGDGSGDGSGDSSGESSGKVMHTLTCQTCSKNFEHINPRLRDCLECYRTKRKERRRGGDKHKNVIQNPVAQQVVSKQPSREPRENGARENGQRDNGLRDNGGREGGNQNERHFDRMPDRTQTVERVSAVAAPRIDQPSAWAQLQKPVRSYRKAIEETRLITGSLKRRLERPDLPEGERRWLEQIYAYQLILHQGWRHLAEYKSGSTGQGKPQED